MARKKSSVKSSSSLEVSNKMVVMFLSIAMVISVVGTASVLYQLSSLKGAQSPTGFATQEDGYATINITSTLAIDVDDANNTIDFGTCNIPAPGINANFSSEMTEAQLNASNGGAVNCTGSNLPAKIRILNVGNTNANIDFQSDTTAAALLGSGAFYYRTETSTVDGGCSAGDVANFASVSGASQGICSTLGYGASSNAVDFFVNISINTASTTGGSPNTATLTFTGS